MLVRSPATGFAAACLNAAVARRRSAAAAAAEHGHRTQPTTKPPGRTRTRTRRAVSR
jgi:hypothetical protein